MRLVTARAGCQRSTARLAWRLTRDALTCKFIAVVGIWTHIQARIAEKELRVVTFSALFSLAVTLEAIGVAYRAIVVLEEESFWTKRDALALEENGEWRTWFLVTFSTNVRLVQWTGDARVVA